MLALIMMRMLKQAKDKRIKKPEEEIRQLKLELQTLRGQLYDSK